MVLQWISFAPDGTDDTQYENINKNFNKYQSDTNYQTLGNKTKASSPLKTFITNMYRYGT